MSGSLPLLLALVACAAPRHEPALDKVAAPVTPVGGLVADVIPEALPPAPTAPPTGSIPAHAGEEAEGKAEVAALLRHRTEVSSVPDEGVGLGGGGVASVGIGGGGYGRGGGAAYGGATSLEVRRDRPRDVEVPAALPALKAGRTDDNADFADYLAFLRVWTDQPGVRGATDVLDVAGRGYVDVVDAGGRPLPGVPVALLSGGRVVQEATTYGDGAAPLYPRLSGAEHGPLSVRVGRGSAAVTVAWDGRGRVPVALGVPTAREEAVPVDVVFTLDTTGSMGDEIERIKATLLDVTRRLDALGRPVDLRLGAVLYRDRGDAYVTHPLQPTSNLAAFARELAAVTADGGGDTPEDLNAALDVTVRDMPWRDGAAKVVFVVADAPPHMDYGDERTYGPVARDALARGIRVHTVAASGLDPVGSLVFRQIAQLTQGQFVFVEYGGDMIGSAAAHGVDGRQIASNNLDAILYDRIRDEVEGWRRPPHSARTAEAVAVQASGGPIR